MPHTKRDQVTFRLSIDNATAAKLDAVMERLTAAGFDVTAEGRRGFSVSGSQELTEAVFHSPIEFDGESARFTSDAKADILPDSLQYRVFFPSKPTFY